MFWGIVLKLKLLLFCYAYIITLLQCVYNMYLSILILSIFSNGHKLIRVSGGGGTVNEGGIDKFDVGLVGREIPIDLFLWLCVGTRTIH